jgi:hypothetical protein
MRLIRHFQALRDILFHQHDGQAIGMQAPDQREHFLDQ